MKTIMVDGGCGRVICAIPAIEEYAKQHPEEKINVVTSWMDPFINSTKIHRYYHVGHQYLWEDVIKQSEMLHPEPYWDNEYYNQDLHLIQAFYKTLGLEVPKDIPRPKIYISNMEEKNASNYLHTQLNAKNGNKKRILIQPFGAGARYDPEKKEIFDESNRSISLNLIIKIIKALNKKYNISLMTVLDIPELRNPQLKLHYPKGQLREWFVMSSLHDYIIGVDSLAQHLAYAHSKPGYFIYGGTYPKNLAYPDHKVYVKKGYPKEYNPIRLPANMPRTSFNDGAMEFTAEEEDKIVKEIVKNVELAERNNKKNK